MNRLDITDACRQSALRILRGENAGDLRDCAEMILRGLKNTGDASSSPLISGKGGDSMREQWGRHLSAEPSRDAVYAAVILLESALTGEEGETGEYLLSPFRDFGEISWAVGRYDHILELPWILTKVAPFIEHYPLESRIILRRCLQRDMAVTAKFLADLAVVSYPFADDLFAEAKRWAEEDGMDAMGVETVFSSAWAEVEKIRENRILLFPELAD